MDLVTPDGKIYSIEMIDRVKLHKEYVEIFIVGGFIEKVPYCDNLIKFLEEGFEYE